MPLEKQKIPDIAGQIKERKKIKDAVSLVTKKQTKPNRNSDKFLARYGQHLRKVLQDKYFLEQIKEIRKKLEIDVDGFNVKNDEKKFEEWINKNSKDCFKHVIEVLNESKYRIETNPIELLNFLHQAVKDKVGPDCYYRDNTFILICPSIEIYENYVSEKPFAGIFDYILFGEIFLPQANLLSMFTSYSDKFILLGISPDTTKRDILELWTEIHEEQKKLSNYKKTKERFKKNFDSDVKILEYDKETERQIEEKELKGKNAIEFRNRRLHEHIEEKYYTKEETENMVFKNEKKILKNRRKQKGRIKKLIGPN